MVTAVLVVFSPEKFTGMMKILVTLTVKCSLFQVEFTIETLRLIFVVEVTVTMTVP
jgi:hypothetical protein